MADIQTEWTWNFSGRVSSSKATSRPALPKETAWDLIGFDGNSSGGLRTHPGFVQLDTFTPTGTVVNVFPVTVLRGATNYTHGYVYVRESSGSTYYTLRAWRTDNSTFETVELHNIAATSLEVDVQAIGRFIYLFARGQSPAMCFLNDSGAISRTLISPAGQGTAPTSEARKDPDTSPPAQTANIRVTPKGHTSETDGTATGITPKFAINSKGSYGFSIQYMATTTGRKTQVSPAAVVTTDTSKFQSLKYTVLGKTGYDKALIYRTVNQGTGGGAYAGAPMHLEAIQDISGLANDAVSADFFVTNKDRSLVYKDVYVDRGTLETTMPKGGVAQFLDGTLFISRVSGAPTIPSETTPLTPPSGLGELRWSSLLETLPENFNPFSRWVPQTPSNEILGMRKVGSFMIGFGQDRIYHIRRQGAYCRIEEMHPGYGLAARYGMEAVGNLIYFVSNRGLKAISSEGQVDDVTGLNRILNDQWLGSVSTVQMAYDAATMCLYTMKPTTGVTASGHAACMWFSTSCMTELYDLPFTFLRGGSWLNTTTNTLERRSLFFCQTSASVWGVYAPAKTQTQYLNLLGGTVVDLGTVSMPIANKQIDRNASTDYPYGCAGYVVASPSGTSDIGKRILLSDQTSLNTLAVGDVISIAPVYMQWTGANIGSSQDPSMDGYKEFFRNKQVSSCSAYVEYANGASSPITDAYNTATNYNPFWMAQLFRGANTLSIGDNIPVDNQPLAGPAFPGAISASGVSIACFGPNVDPESVPSAPFGKHGVVYSSLSPSWTCFWPGVDITLLAFSAKGKILDTDRRFL